MGQNYGGLFLVDGEKKQGIYGSIILKNMICPICKTAWLVIGNLLAGTFQQYEQQCNCDAQPVNQEEEGKNEQLSA